MCSKSRNIYYHTLFSLKLIDSANDLKFECIELNFPKDLGTEKLFEICGIELTKFGMCILCIYRTPDSNINIFFDKLHATLSKLEQKYKKVIICGDFNLNILVKNRSTVQFKEILSNFGLQFHIHEPTRLDTCIDNIISNVAHVTGTTHNFCLSDHNTAQVATFNNLKFSNLPDYSFRFIKDFCKENVTKFVNSIGSLSFSEVFSISSANNAFNAFHDLITLFFSLCFPTVKIKTMFTNKPKKFSKGLKISSKHKRLLRFKYYKNKNSNNKKTFQIYSSILKKCFNKNKKLCNDYFIANSTNVCKATWNVVNEEIGKKKCSNFIDKLCLDGMNVTSGHLLADIFNDFFINLTNVSQASPISHQSVNNPILNIKSNCHSLYLEPVTSGEILKIIMSLKNTHSAGYDCLTTNLIKLTSNIIAKPLAYIINLTFEQGSFPDRLKISIIKPLFKKGSKTDKNNYRPIALIPILSKIFEKAIYNRFISFFTKFNILAKQQFGFRKFKSTSLATYHLINLILNNLNNKTACCALFLDLSKAFDFVDHAILLQKLDKYGVRGPALNLLTNYLSDRQQITRVTKLDKDLNCITNYDSTQKTTHRGVPQGSILGPLLFLLYVNDMPLATKHNSILFADDTTIVIKCSTIYDYENDVMTCLSDIINWLNSNKLTINLSKTKIIQFRTKQSKLNNLNINYNNINIEQVNCTKFLGIQIDAHLSWKQHIDMICSKINSFVFAIKKIRTCTSLQTVLMAYHAHVCSLIHYGIIIWGNSPDIARVFLAQKKCLRAVFGMKWAESCKPVFESHNLLTVASIYILEIAKFIQFNGSLFEEFNNVNARLVTQVKLKMPVPSLDLFRRNCIYMAPLIYNSLPNNIINAPPRKFTVVLKKWLIKECFYTVDEFLKKSACRYYLYGKA